MGFTDPERRWRRIAEYRKQATPIPVPTERFPHHW